jgi:hypothetical protein
MKMANDLIPGTLISIRSFQLESLGENKYRLTEFSRSIGILSCFIDCSAKLMI